jgi:hypothetical protein
LEKIFSSKEQQKWVEKMQGFDFEIIYKKWKDNVVIDALSRIEEALSLYSITSSILMCLEEVPLEWQDDNSTGQKIQGLKEEMICMEHWKRKRDILWYKGRIYVCY